MAFTDDLFAFGAARLQTPFSVRFSELHVQLHLALILRMPSYPFAKTCKELREAEYAYPAPLNPFLSEWLQNGAYSCIMSNVGSGVRLNFIDVREDGRIRVRSSICDIRTSQVNFKNCAGMVCFSR